LTGQSASNLRIVSRDETNDLALVQTAGAFKNIAHLRGSAVHSGDSVIAIGYPYHGLLTSDFTVTTGIVSSLSGILNDTRFLQISAPVQQGNSGGPLLDTSGNVVGVVSEKLNAVRFAKVTGDIPENVNFAIKTGAVRDFLDNSVIPYQTSDAGIEQKTTQIASDARAYTMLITCTAKIEEQTK
jgi:S1-C subfamily serine protease